MNIILYIPLFLSKAKKSSQQHLASSKTRWIFDSFHITCFFFIRMVFFSFQDEYS